MHHFSTGLTCYSEKHSAFSTTFPIYIKEKKTSQVPIESEDEFDDEDAIVDENEQKFETVTEEQWVRVNDKPPIWMRQVYSQNFHICLLLKLMPMQGAQGS